jgi:hypothetical protein
MLSETEAMAVQAHERHADIYRLEAELLKLPQVDMPVAHEFCAGLMARTMRIPAGVAATGAIHSSDSFFVVRHGVLLSTSDYDEPVRLCAGDQVVSKAGSKRAVVTLSDVVITTYHPNPTGETDPHKLWELFTVPDAGSLLSAKAAEVLS